MKTQIKNQTGRSMVELLGVIAVMGFLTVMGAVIMGNGISTYKINALSNQLSTIYKKTVSSFANEPNYLNLGSNKITGTKNAIKRNIIPDNMVKNETTPVVTHALGGSFAIASNGNDFFTFYITGLNKSACVDTLVALPPETVSNVKIATTTISSPFEVSDITGACLDDNDIEITYKTNYFYSK